MKLDDAKHAPQLDLFTTPIARHIVPAPGTVLLRKRGPGRPRNPVIDRLMKQKTISRTQAYRELEKRRLGKMTRRERLLAETLEFSSLIKPSDNWNFSKVFYDRIDDGHGSHGYIPGELYLNCLWYFTKPGDLVVAPMAGSGMVQHVYEDRALWMKPAPWDLDLRMFDLTPRGRYASLIRPWDLTRGFPPIERSPDYVVIDPPYLGACRGQYSGRPDDIANMEDADWTEAMALIARSCASAGTRLATIVVPTWVDSDADHVVLCTEVVRRAWEREGYGLARICYATKHIQAGRADRIKVLNNRAKRKRSMLSDISEVLTFRRDT